MTRIPAQNNSKVFLMYRCNWNTLTRIQPRDPPRNGSLLLAIVLRGRFSRFQVCAFTYVRARKILEAEMIFGRWANVRGNDHARGSWFWARRVHSFQRTLWCHNHKKNPLHNEEPMKAGSIFVKTISWETNLSTLTREKLWWRVQSLRFEA